MNKKYNQGYIAMLVMLITGFIIVIIMLQQYKKSGLLKQQNSKLINQTTDNSMTPIDSANNIKNILEKRDSEMLNN